MGATSFDVSEVFFFPIAAELADCSGVLLQTSSSTGGNDGYDCGYERRETVSLIGSDKVDGTAVYGADERKIGSVQRVMIDKISGKVAYAVVSFGGFLGMGEDYYPIPWPNLKYDTRLGGYRVGVTEDQLKGAPKFNRNTDWDWSDRARDRSVYDYYKTPLWY